ncbi:murein L,D-transpeptidase family protein [Bacteroidota bacterium]
MINQDISFKENQLKYPRVRTAYAEKGDYVVTLLEEHNLIKEDLRLFIRVFKDTEILEIWASKSDQRSYKRILEFPFCATSGDLGPKRVQGDGQIPEGFYHIDRFNPASNFYLSLGINYPNQSDRILGDPYSPGGDIFIHGNCVTIGCIPITDQKIKELYILAVEARNNGQEKIPVHIFPSQLDEESFNFLSKRTEDTALTDFWKGLSGGYMFFERNLQLPLIKINAEGDYVIE